MEVTEIISYAAGVVGMGTGIATVLRSRSQNRTERDRLYFEQDQSLRTTMLSDIAALRAQTTLLAEHNDKLEQLLREGADPGGWTCPGLGGRPRGCRLGILPDEAVPRIPGHVRVVDDALLVLELVRRPPPRRWGYDGKPQETDAD